MTGLFAAIARANQIKTQRVKLNETMSAEAKRPATLSVADEAHLRGHVRDRVHRLLRPERICAIGHSRLQSQHGAPDPYS